MGLLDIGYQNLKVRVCVRVLLVLVPELQNDPKMH